MSDRRLLVYIPLPPHAHWRGEGIAQTIENILLNLPSEQKITVLTSSETAATIASVFAQRSNIEVISWFGRPAVAGRTTPTKAKNPLNDADTGIVGRVTSRLARKATSIALAGRYIWAKFLTDLMLRRRMIAKNCSAIWVPQLAFDVGPIPGLKKIASFWDPFVFEYSDFGNRKSLLKMFAKRISTADAIITQSKYNKSYLRDVLGLSEESIFVINNGSPDYSKLDWHDRSTSSSKAHLDLQTLTNKWPESWSTLSDKKAASAFIDDRLNHSVLFRLKNDSTEKTKAIFVSTQYRPYKGFETLFQIYDTLVRNDDGADYRFLFTGEVPKRIKDRYSWSTNRIYELSRLSTIQHMCIYRISSLVLHPSLVEGGVGVYPTFEAASVGIPSLMNSGRHTSELIDQFTEATELVTDFARIDQTITAIKDLLGSKEKAQRNVELANKARIEWSDAAKLYATIFDRFVRETPTP